MYTKDNKDDFLGCLGVIGFFVCLWFAGFVLRQCKISVIKTFNDGPPYYSTDDDRYHISGCPYMSEDNYVGEEYESQHVAKSDGLEPCPYCIGD